MATLCFRSFEYGPSSHSGLSLGPIGIWGDFLTGASGQIWVKGTYTVTLTRTMTVWVCCQLVKYLVYFQHKYCYKNLLRERASLPVKKKAKVETVLFANELFQIVILILLLSNKLILIL